MSLYYLLIPVASFFVILAWSWRTINVPPYDDQFGFGELQPDELSRIASVLMTAKRSQRYAAFSVGARVAELTANFRADGVDFELPLCTVRQKRQTKRLTAIFEEHCKHVEVASRADGEEFISGSVEGNVHFVTSRLSLLCTELLDVKPAEMIHCVVQSRPRYLSAMGLSILDQLEAETARDQLPETSTAATEPKKLTDPRIGCLTFMVLLFLNPIPFLMAYAWYGIWTACVVGLVVFAAFTTWQFAVGLRTTYKSVVSKLNSLLSVGGYASVVMFETAWFLQIVPTIYCIVWGAGVFIGHIGGKPWFEPPDIDYGRTGRILITGGTTLACVLGALANEYIRTQFSLDYWVWYFAYFRLELLIGVVFLATPGVTVGAMHVHRQMEVGKGEI